MFLRQSDRGEERQLSFISSLPKCLRGTAGTGAGPKQEFHSRVGGRYPSTTAITCHLPGASAGSRNEAEAQSDPKHSDNPVTGHSNL